MAPATEAVVFDIGNVLIGWDPRRLYRTLFEDDAAIDAFMDEVGFHAWLVELDRGRAFEEAVEMLAARFPHHRDAIAAFHHRWQETLSGPIEGTVAILEELHAAGVPLYAITNFPTEKYAETRPNHRFFERFQDIVVSGHERLVKPEPGIYRLLVARAGIDPAAAVFIDDSRPNVDAARAAGFDAVHFRSPRPLRAELIARGLPLAPAP
jgi:2-haloacid dehalogenase